MCALHLMMVGLIASDVQKALLVHVCRAGCNLLPVGFDARRVTGHGTLAWHYVQTLHYNYTLLCIRCGRSILPSLPRWPRLRWPKTSRNCTPLHYGVDEYIPLRRSPKFRNCDKGQLKVYLYLYTSQSANRHHLPDCLGHSYNRKGDTDTTGTTKPLLIYRSFASP